MCDCDRGELREKLLRFYNKHCPEKVVDVDRAVSLAHEAEMTEFALFTKLCEKYNTPYDPLDWKPELIGKNTVGGAAVTRAGGYTKAGDHKALSTPNIKTELDTPSPKANRGALTPRAVSPSKEEEVDETEARRKKLVAFYNRYNPAKLSDVERIIELAVDSTEDDLFVNLCKKYNLPLRDVFTHLNIKSDRFKKPGANGGRGISHADFREKLQTSEGQEKGEAVLRAEFSEWISNTLGIKPPLDETNVFEKLRDGVILCRLVEKLDRTCKIKYHSNPTNHFQKLANVDAFQKVCQKDFGVQQSELFDPQDLVDGASPTEQRAIMTLFLSLAKTAHQKFSSQAPQIVRLEMEIEKEEGRGLTNKQVNDMLNKKKEEEEKRKKEEEERLKEEERRRKEEEMRLKREEEEFERKRKEAERLAALQRQKEAERRKYEEQAKLLKERERQKQEERLRLQRIRMKEEEDRRNNTLHPYTAEDSPVFQYKNQKYIADRKDPIDLAVSHVLNNLPSQTPSCKMYKLTNGQYVIEYPKRIVFFVRVCRNTALVRVGGGWQSLEEFLRDRLRMYPETRAKFIPLIREAGTDIVIPLHMTAIRMRDGL